MTSSAHAYLELLRRTRVMPQRASAHSTSTAFLRKLCSTRAQHVPFLSRSPRSSALRRRRRGSRFTSLARGPDTDAMQRQQQAGAEIFAARGARRESGDWSERQTSGSTGTAVSTSPQQHRELRQYVRQASRLRGLSAQFRQRGRQHPSNSSRAIRIFPRARRVGGISMAVGPILVFDVRSSVKQQFDWLLKACEAPYLRVIYIPAQGIGRASSAETESSLCRSRRCFPTAKI